MASTTTMEGGHAGQERSDNGPGMVFCWCPAGSFRMGSDDVLDTLSETFVTPDVVAAHDWAPKRPGAAVEEGDENVDEDEGDDPTSSWACFGDEAPADVTLRQGFWIG